jgi:DNA-binding IscR family transcriptional regulator
MVVSMKESYALRAMEDIAENSQGDYMLLHDVAKQQ